MLLRGGELGSHDCGGTTPTKILAFALVPLAGAAGGPRLAGQLAEAVPAGVPLPGSAD